MRDPKLQRQDRDRDRDDAVAERLEAGRFVAACYGSGDLVALDVTRA